MQLPVENFSQIAQNPFLSGISQGQQMANTAMMFPQQLRQAMMNNQILRQQVPFAGPMAQAQLQQAQALPALTQAQTSTVGTQGQLNLSEAYKNQIQARMMPYMMGMKMGGAQFMTDENGNIHMIWNPMAAMQAAQQGNGQQARTVQVPNQGGQPQQNSPMTLQQGQGMPLPAYGGSSIPMGNGMPAYQGGSMMPNFSLAARDPRMGPAKGGAGGVYTNLANGQTISSPTEKNVTQLQQGIGAMERIAPQLKTILQGISPYTTLGGIADKYGAQALNAATGKATPDLLNYSKAEGLIPGAAETLTRAYIVNPTNETLEMMKEALQPRIWDSPSTYQARIVAQLQALINNRNIEKTSLAQGFPLNNSNQNANQMLGSSNNAQGQVNGGSPPPGAVQAANNMPQNAAAMQKLPQTNAQVNALRNMAKPALPSWPTQAAFNKWKANATPDQLALVKSAYGYK